MIKTHSLLIREVDRKVFEAIKDGSKTIETRAATEKHKVVEVGDVLCFVCGENRLEKKVKSVNLFDSVEELTEKFDFKKIVPFSNSAEEVKEIIFGFPGNEEKVNKFGLIAFGLE